MKCHRAAILRFDPAGQALYEPDGLLAVGPDEAGLERVQAVGPFTALQARFGSVPIEHWPGRIIAPGFVDLHVHYPQVDIIGSPASGLLPWLENYTFPQESRFTDPAHCAQTAEFYVVQDTATKKCTIVDKKPTTTTTTVVDNGTFKTRTEAETGMKSIKVCTEN